jgi:hypothetical protein
MSKKKSKVEEECPALPNPPSHVEYNNMNFLIFDAPSDDNLETYAKVCNFVVLSCFGFRESQLLVSAGAQILQCQSCSSSM